MRFDPGTLKFRFLASLMLVIFFSVFILMGGSCGAPSFGKETQGKLETALEDTMSESKAPGNITGIWTPDGTWVVAKGKADVETDLPMKTTDLMRIGSVTKTFTATLVLLLADDGKLSLDNKLAEYVPDFPNADRITIRQLLNHSSGIPGWDEIEGFFVEVVRNPEKGWTVEKMVQASAEQPLLFEPGTGYSYSNTGYFLLGAIIEKVSGNTVATELGERIAQPLGMDNTFLPDGPTFEGDTVHGYEVKDGRLVDTTGTEAAKIINYDLAYTAGGIVSTLEDMKVWAKALATGELLSDEMHQEQMPKNVKDSPEAPFESGYGFGVGQAYTWIGHTGGVAGFETNVYYYPEKDATIVTYFNKLSVASPEAILPDLEAYTNYFVELSKIIYPETFEGVSAGE